MSETGAEYDLKKGTLRSKVSPFEIGLIALMVVVVIVLVVFAVLVLIAIGNLKPHDDGQQKSNTRSPLSETFYVGQLTHSVIQYNSNISDPTSTLAQDMAKFYKKEIEKRLAPLFSSKATATIAQFSSSYRSQDNVKGNGLVVEFWLRVKRPSNPPSVESLRKGLNADFIFSDVRIEMVQPKNEPRNAAAASSQNVSNGWKELSEILAKSIDFSVDPCENFYDFACGQWKRRHPVAQRATRSSVFEITQAKVYDDILVEMNKINMSDPTTLRSSKLARIAFEKCMMNFNNQANYSDGSRILAELQKLGGWPILNQNWSLVDPNPQEYFSKLVATLSRDYLTHTIFVPETRANFLNTSMPNVLFLNQAQTIFPKNYYEHNQIINASLKAEKDSLMRVAKVLGMLHGQNNSDSWIEEQVDAILALDKELVSFTLLATEMKNVSKLFNLYTVDQAKQMWPNLDWQTYISELLKSVDMQNQTNSTEFSIKVPSFVTMLNKTYFEPRVLQNYLIWPLLKRLLTFFPTKSLQEDVSALNSGIAQSGDYANQLEYSCMTVVEYAMQPAVGRLYVDSYFGKPENAKNIQLVSDMTSRIIDQFQRMYQTVPWLSGSSLEGADKKTNNLLKNIGFPEWIKNDTRLDEVHQKLDLSESDNFFDIVLKLSKFVAWWLNFNQLTQPRDRHSFLFSGGVALVSASYVPEHNAMVVPLARMNSPFYQVDYPMSFNYGGLGRAIAHELTHGFDNAGVQFDFEGTIGHPWMDQTATDGFNEMAQCVAEEYSQYCLQRFGTVKHCVNGNQTLGENLADNGGLRAAFNAYKKQAWLRGAEPPLPGKLAKFTHDQLFFLSFGQSWCANYPYESLLNMLLVNPHSPPDYRVLGTVRNMPAFAEAFHCKPGSAMAPPAPEKMGGSNAPSTPRCNVWVGSKTQH